MVRLFAPDLLPLQVTNSALHLLLCVRWWAILRLIVAKDLVVQILGEHLNVQRIGARLLILRLCDRNVSIAAFSERGAENVVVLPALRRGVR